MVLKRSLWAVGISLSVVAAGCGGPRPEAVGTHSHRTRAHGSKTTTSAPTTTTSTSTTTTVPTKTTVPVKTTVPNKATVPITVPKSPVASPTVPTTTSAPADPNFKGIYEFATNSSADAKDPDLAGVDLNYYWSQIEPEKGVFDWSLIDDDMAPWVAAGKKVILRISTSGQADWDLPYSGDATPQWVFADGARSISDSGETIPVYWDQAYLDDYASFVQAFGQQFDGNPHVAFIEAGIGMDGETLPETNASASGTAAWEADGYTDALWLKTVETIASFFEASFHTTPIFPLVDQTFFDGNSTDYDALVSWFKAVPNWGLQYDGLTSTQQLSSQWSGLPIALEQRNPTSVSGDCLCADISNGLDNLHGTYLLIYQSDIDNPANAGYLAQAAAEAR